MAQKPTIVLRAKDQAVLQALLDHPMHHKLTDIVYWIFSCGFVPYLTITSAFRKSNAAYPNSTHSTEPCRALDIRSWDQDDPQGLVDHINNHWQYDSARPRMQCAMIHNVGKGEHIHLQVHPNTVLIKGGW